MSLRIGINDSPEKTEFLTSENCIGDSTYRCDDGLFYHIREDRQTVGVMCADDVRNTLEHAEIAYEVVIDGKTYPVTTVFSNAFQGCGALKKVTLSSNLRVIESFAFSRSAISEAIIPHGCKIQNRIFEGCKHLKKVVLPYDLIEIPYQSFRDCSLETIDLPEGLQNIGFCAFQNTQLTEITLPSSLTLIDEGVFDGCDKLSNVYSKITNPAACKVKSFELPANSVFAAGKEFYSQATLHVPNDKGLVSAYKKKVVWKKFSNIVADL